MPTRLKQAITGLFGIADGKRRESENANKILNTLYGNDNSMDTGLIRQADNTLNTFKSTPKPVNSGASFNPFLKSDGTRLNPYANYRKVLDNPNSSTKVKEWITAATGQKPTEVRSAAAEGSVINSIEENNNEQPVSSAAFDGSYDSSQLGGLDIKTELPKLSVGQISAVISKHFANSPVIKPSDAEGIYNAQQNTGMSALAMLGIGALESAYGTSSIARQKNNLWGYGAINSNPAGGAHAYSQMSQGAAQFASEFMKDYYDGYGAKTINSAGTGNNPAGKGYAYSNNGSINPQWAVSVSSIMGKLYDTAKAYDTGSTPGSRGSTFANAAKKYLGTGYIWGGASPSGFDCSGLVQYTAKQMGVNLPRTTYEQIKSGTPVNSKNDLQPGDLVFFGANGSPHHVGIYAGNGQYIHSPRTGDVVKISSLSGRNDYLTGRRIL